MYPHTPAPIGGTGEIPYIMSYYSGAPQIEPQLLTSGLSREVRRAQIPTRRISRWSNTTWLGRLPSCIWSCGYVYNFVHVLSSSHEPQTSSYIHCTSARLYCSQRQYTHCLNQLTYVMSCWLRFYHETN